MAPLWQHHPVEWPAQLEISDDLELLEDHR